MKSFSFKIMFECFIRSVIFIEGIIWWLLCVKGKKDIESIRSGSFFMPPVYTELS